MEVVFDKLKNWNIGVLEYWNDESTPKSQKIKNATKTQKHENPQNKDYQ